MDRYLFSVVIFLVVSGSRCYADELTCASLQDSLKVKTSEALAPYRAIETEAAISLGIRDGLTTAQFDDENSYLLTESLLACTLYPDLTWQAAIDAASMVYQSTH